MHGPETSVLFDIIKCHHSKRDYIVAAKIHFFQQSTYTLIFLIRLLSPSSNKAFWDDTFIDLKDLIGVYGV